MSDSRFDNDTRNDDARKNDARANDARSLERTPEELRYAAKTSERMLKGLTGERGIAKELSSQC